MAAIWQWREETAAALWEEAKGHLTAAGLVALPTETFYALAADPFQEEALARLFSLKGRPSEKPVLLLVSGLNMLSQVAVDIPDLAQHLMARFWPGPLTLILPARPGLSRRLTDATNGVAVRQPRHEVTCRLIDVLGFPVTGTSANRSGQPAFTQARELAREFGGDLALIVDAGPCPGGLPSTIADVRAHPPRVLRAGAVAIADLGKMIPNLSMNELTHGEKTTSPGP